MRSNLISISISIHALREEGDSLSEAITKLKADFYPRPPRGGRLLLLLGVPADGLISIHALREEGDGATCKVDTADTISIHALREEGDVGAGVPRFLHGEFLSTPSARRATVECKVPLILCKISIHALREEGDIDPLAAQISEELFLSTPSARRATRSASHYQPGTDFYPRPPRGGRPLFGVAEDVMDLFLSTPSARRATG